MKDCRRAVVKMIGNSTNNVSKTNSFGDSLLSPLLQFWLLLPVLIPSVICSILLLVHLLTTPVSRRALNNHVIIILLLLSLLYLLFNTTFSLVFYQLGVVLFATPIFCKLWLFFDFGTYNSGLIFMAWFSFERHLLVFHGDLMATRCRCLAYHYCPLIGLSIYLIVYYVYFMFFYECENIFDYTQDACGGWPCILNDKRHKQFYNNVHGIVPILLIVLFNVGLVVRATTLKRRLNPSLSWKKQRKMVTQLLSVSILYICVNLPLWALNLMYQPGLGDVGSKVNSVFFFMTTYLMMLIPFVSLHSLPEVWIKIRKVFPKCQQRPTMAILHPKTLPISR